MIAKHSRGGSAVSAVRIRNGSSNADDHKPRNHHRCRFSRAGKILQQLEQAEEVHSAADE